ncbi:MAG: ferrous iron transport protein B [Lachnospiraceae bacterium]
MAYTVALAGNPNSGKTTLFNDLTGSKQHVGNWPGVTVDKKEGLYKRNKELRLLDLPGTYSLSPYSTEEIVARDYIVKERPDVVINIVDGTSIERNLYLTLQILETGIPTVVALNMMDEVAAKGDKIDIDKLSKLLGVPVVPIVARVGKGIHELMDATSKVAQTKKIPDKLDIYDDDINHLIAEIKDTLTIANEYEKEWAAIKLVEGDDLVRQSLSADQAAAAKAIIDKAQAARKEDYDTVIADLRYKFIGKITGQAVKKGSQGHVVTKSDKLDKILTNRFLALPIFAVIMYILFAATFSESFLFIPGLPSPGVWLAGLTETFWGWLTGVVDAGLGAIGTFEWLHALVLSCMDGIGAVIGFLPLVLVLFLLLSFLEDSGYMARVAFVMDRIFRHFGLSGRSFIPLLMGFGCSVPALMASRTLENEKDRKITMMITPFMSCGAKLPIYLMFVGTLFSSSNRTQVLFTIYMIGVLVAILSAFILGKLIKGDQNSNFIMELPQYRLPTIKSVLIHAWEKVKGFAIKAGTVIFAATILIWFLSSFNFSGMVDMEDSFLASIGNFIKVIFVPLGFADWRASVGVVTGWIAKENIVATFGQLFGGVSDEVVEAVSAGEQSLPAIKDVFNLASAWSYMAFNLLCMPCFAAVGAIKREMGSWKWTLRAIAYQMITAYVVAFIVYRIALLIYGL